MKKVISVVLSIVLTAILCFSVSCSAFSTARSTKFSYAKTPYQLNEAELRDETSRNALLKYSGDLIKSLKPNENGVISPYSAYLALALTINGAHGNTLTQMEKVMGLQRDKLNVYAANLFAKYLENADYKDYISSADSIWFNTLERSPLESFLELVSKYYGAEIYGADFSDNGTVNLINNWISDKTDKKLKNVLDRIPKDAIMYLINTLLFKSKWIETYSAPRSVKFTNLSGNGEATANSFGVSSQTYYRTDGYSGFSIPYEAPGISFVGVLPDSNTSDALNGFNGEKLISLINGIDENNYSISSTIPCFKTSVKTDLTEFFSDPERMPVAFSKNDADFSEMYEIGPDFNVYISRVFQDVTIELDEKGTEAAAATVVEIGKATSVEPNQRERLQLNLDRPFIYIIMDTVNNVPLFIGKIVKM